MKGSPLIEFKTSSFCNWGNCVEVCWTPDGAVLVRDSKHPEQEPLSFTDEEWKAFVEGVKAGEFDVDALQPSG
jgi:hypothetical protein